MFQTPLSPAGSRVHIAPFDMPIPILWRAFPAARNSPIQASVNGSPSIGRGTDKPLRFRGLLAQADEDDIASRLDDADLVSAARQIRHLYASARHMTAG